MQPLIIFSLHLLFVQFLAFCGFYFTIVARIVGMEFGAMHVCVQLLNIICLLLSPLTLFQNVLPLERVYSSMLTYVSAYCVSSLVAALVIQLVLLLLTTHNKNGSSQKSLLVAEVTLRNVSVVIVALGFSLVLIESNYKNTKTLRDVAAKLQSNER